MTSGEVHVRATHGEEPRRFKIRINGQSPTFRLKSENIEAQTLEPMDDLLLDLLEVAGAVFFADSAMPRGSGVRTNFGERWQRDFDFRLRVRQPEIWSRGDVRDALVDAVTFLTGDRYRFAFDLLKSRAQTQEYLAFRDEVAPAFRIDEVILFSGGLDSLTGALEALKTRKGRVALVTHRSAHKVRKTQTHLGDALRERYPGRVLHIPVEATRIGAKAADRSQRSRSFLFAALGYVVARLLGAKRVSFYENGIIGHNLPISGQVVGTMATRTTHPQSLLLLERLLHTLATPPIAIENPYEWDTKTEVLQRLSAAGGASLVRKTISCTSVTSRTVRKPHCGACSQCLDRRFAVLAAGLEAHDPVEDYATDVLFGERTEERSRTMALDWTKHALRIPDMQDREFVHEFCGELLRITKGYPQLATEEAMKRTRDLHARQGRVVRKTVNQAISNNADALLRGGLPETSLLRMLVGEATWSIALPFLARKRKLEIDAASSGRGAANAPLLPLQLQFLTIGGEQRVDIIGLTQLTGRNADVTHALRPAFEEDREKKVTRERAQYVPTKNLAAALELKNAAVRKCVSRCRAEVAEAYEQVVGAPADRTLLIQERERQGYRIDPDCRLVESDDDSRPR